VLDKNSGSLRGVTVRVLGITTILVHGESVNLTPVERNLLALLVAAGPVGANTDQLADGLWQDQLPDSWRASLRNTISRLNIKVREQLGAGTGNDQGGRTGDPVALVSGRTTVRRLQLALQQVDAWRLLAWVGGDRDYHDPDLLLGTPFSGCEIPNLVQGVADQIDAARYDIITSWDTDEVRLPAQTLAVIRQLCANDPLDERLAVMAGRLHLLVDDRPGARAVIAGVERELTLTRRPLPAPLATLKRQVEGGDPTWVSSGRHQASGQGSSGLRTSKPLRSSALTRLAVNEIVGRDQLVDHLVDQVKPDNPLSTGRIGGVSLYGPGGVGKTRLAVETALRLQTDGYNTIYIVADDHRSGPLQPFLQSLRFLQPIVEPYLSRLNEPEVATRCWAVALQAIESAIAPGPTCLVADDVHWFDEHSRSMLLSLCRAELSSPVVIIAAGREGEPGALWSSWLDDLGRTGCGAVEVDPLDRSAISDLIDSRPGLRPERGRQSAIGQVHNNRLAQLVLELSSGVPQVALWLLDQHEKYWAGDTPSSPVFDLKDRPGEAALSGTGYAVMVDTLDPELIEIGSVASVLGMRFPADELTALIDLDFETCVGRLDDLVDHQLLTTTPGEYGFFHILVAEAFNRRISASRRRQLHSRAFGLSGDLHRRARHAANSVPVTPLAEAMDALVRSARAHFATGNYVSSWATWQRAMELDPDALELDDSIMALESADRAGLDTGAERERLVARALGDGLPQVALGAAVSGLPATELVHGDPGRVRAIRMIDPARLDHEHALRWKWHLSRQLVWLGEMDEARTLAHEVYDTARNADERANGWLAVTLATTWTHNPQALDGLTWIDDVVDPELRAKITRTANMARVVVGQSRSHRRLFDDQLDTARRNRSPLDEWWAMVQKATVLTDLGRQDEAMALSVQALDLGVRAGVRVAYGVHETQRVGWALRTRELGDLLDHMEALAAADTPNPILSAVVAACRFAAADRHPGLYREAFNLASELSKVLGDGPFSPAVAGLLAEVAGASADSELIAWAEASLEPLRGHHVVVGTATANLGPCHGLLACLTDDRDRRRQYLELARDEADTRRLPLWQVVGRLNLIRHLGPGPHGDRLMDEVTALATTPWLQRIVARGFDSETERRPDDGR
jgi:hypothetical protein